MSSITFILILFLSKFFLAEYLLFSEQIVEATSWWPQFFGSNGRTNWGIGLILYWQRWISISIIHLSAVSVPVKDVGKEDTFPKLSGFEGWYWKHLKLSWEELGKGKGWVHVKINLLRRWEELQLTYDKFTMVNISQLEFMWSCKGIQY